MDARRGAPVRRVLIDLSVLRSTSRLRGIGRYVADLAQGLAALEPPDLELFALSRVSLSGQLEIDRDLGAAHERLASSSDPLWIHRRWARRLRVTLPRAARLARADLVHSGHPEATPLVAVPGRIVTCHDLIPLRYPRYYLRWRHGQRWARRLVDARRYHGAAHVIAVSRATADDLLRLLEVPARRVTVVHNGVDVSRFRPDPEPADGQVLARHGLAERPFALYVGAVDYRKNIDGMLETVRLARQHPDGRDLLFAWAGASSPSADRMFQREVSSRGLSGAARALGYVPDDELAALYRHARALVFLSRCEGFGYPIVEAMACGCPVIACPETSTGEIATGAALLRAPDDHAGAADALRTLTRDERERRRLRAAGIARAAELSLEKMARETAEVYRAVPPA
jgi:glycosyltransferase involved in cell wall biosynthesis